MLVPVGDTNFRGKQFEADLALLDAKIMRPRRKYEPGKVPHLAPIRQRVESIYWTCKDVLTLERHGSRTLPRQTRRLVPAWRISHHHRSGPPSSSEKALFEFRAFTVGARLLLLPHGIAAAQPTAPC